MTPACHSDLCAQGRKACPCPTACQVPESEVVGAREFMADLSAAAILTAVILAALVGLLLLVAGLFGR